MIDLSLFCDVVPSEDRSSVVIGAGAKWIDVSKVLDGGGLAVVGGRNSAVGVGGLTLGGKLLLFASVLWALITSQIRQSRASRFTISFSELINKRRSLLLLTALRPSLLQHSHLRPRPCLRLHHDGLRINQSRPLARPQRRLQQLRHRHALHRPQLPLHHDLERLPLYARLSTRQGSHSFPRMRQ